MPYRLLADLVLVIHLGFIALVAVGPILAWRWTWLVRVHVPVALYAAAIVTIGFTCPLTPLEKRLRRLAGGEAYDGGFIDHYLDGVVYPTRYLAVARAVVVALVVAGYAGLLVRRSRARAPQGQRVAAAARGGGRTFDSDSVTGHPAREVS